jgi:hypothetical protein
MGKRVVLVYPRHITGWQAQPWMDIPIGVDTLSKMNEDDFALLERAGCKCMIRGLGRKC